MRESIRDDFDLEEDRLFISGLEKVGKSRSNYIHSVQKRKAIIGISIAVGVLALLALITGLAIGLRHKALTYQCPRDYASNKVDLTFFVIGDWGRHGTSGQERAARLMSDIGDCMPPKFIISTGDNFYESGLKSADDPQFTESFSEVYSDRSLQVPWYAVLGNHDYGDQLTSSQTNGGCGAPTLEQCPVGCCYSPIWQLGQNATNRDARWNCQQGVITRQMSLGDGRTLDIIMIDTVPLIYRYQTRPWANLAGGVNSQDGDAIKAQIQAQLNASTATWKLVVGHHPIRSFGSHCMQPDSTDCIDMAFLRPWLRRYGVAAYINGHDHDLQLIKSEEDPVFYVVSGAGSDVRGGEFDDLDAELLKDAQFLADDQGFVAVTISGDELRLYFYISHSSYPAYSVVVKRPGSV